MNKALTFVLLSSVLSLSPMSFASVTNIAEGKLATASSSESANYLPEQAIDSNLWSRWASDRTDGNWLAIDLQGLYDIESITLHWEVAFAEDYEIQVSHDGANWTTAKRVTGSNGGVDEQAINEQASHIRIKSLKRGTQWGVSLWEVEVFGAPAVIEKGELVSEGRPVRASSTSEPQLAPSNVVDGNDQTRWSSEYVDNAWIMVDLEDDYEISQVQLRWETAHSQDYEIQTSYDGRSWKTIHRVTGSEGGHETLTVNGHGRFVRVEGLSRATRWGHSLWQLEVYGKALPVERISDGRPVKASSTSEAHLEPANAVDGNRQTRWSSEYVDNAWLMVDLERNHSITEVQLSWETAHALAYEIQTSYDGKSWNTIHRESASRGGDETIQVTGHGRYLRVEGLSRATRWGHSLWELGVYGFEAATGSNDDSSAAGLMTLEWTAPALRENGNYLRPSEIAGYEIRYRKAGESQYQSQFIRNGSATSFAFDWLKGDYEFTIAVYDSKGLYSRFVPLTPREQR